MVGVFGFKEVGFFFKFIFILVVGIDDDNSLYVVEMLSKENILLLIIWKLF